MYILTLLFSSLSLSLFWLCRPFWLLSYAFFFIFFASIAVHQSFHHFTVLANALSLQFCCFFCALPFSARALVSTSSDCWCEFFAFILLFFALLFSNLFLYYIYIFMRFPFGSVSIVEFEVLYFYSLGLSFFYFCLRDDQVLKLFPLIFFNTEFDVL